MELSVIPRQLLEESVCEGNIYYFENDSSFGVPGHMHVCVKRSDRLLFFSTCSSRIQTAMSLSQRFGWDINTFPVYAANQATNRFKESMTYVNCNRCYDISIADFVDLMMKGEVRLLDGSFTEEDLKLISRGVLKSTQIPREVKALFL
ncbi:MAG: hypothetical protein IKM74_03455 [Bacteroidales bacterium]|nr:hypothetical protein [Bacteroidales bacterium]